MVAEGSLRSALAFAVTVGVMQISPGKPDQGAEPARENVLANALKDCYGVPVRAIPVSMTFNTDDTRLLSWDPKKNKGELVLTSSAHTGKDHAVFSGVARAAIRFVLAIWRKQTSLSSWSRRG